MHSKIIVAGLAGMALVWACSSRDFENPYDPQHNNLPEIRLSITPDPVDTVRITTFDASGTIDEGGTGFRMRLLRVNGPEPEIELFGWTWEHRIEYMFEKPGIYELRVELEDDKGALVSKDTLLRVYGANSPPQPGFIILSDSAQAGVEVGFNADGSSDWQDPLSALRFKWDFGDGHVTAWLDSFRTAHVFTAPGTFVIRLYVMDTGNAVDSTEKLLVVYSTSVPPFASFTVSPKFGDAGNSFTFNASGSHDQGADSSGLEFRWVFSLADFPDSILEARPFSTGDVIYNRPFPTAGLKNVLLQVRNARSVVSSAVVSLPVVRTALNDRPYAAFSVTPHRGTTDTDFTVNAGGMIADPEGDQLEVFWDWGENNRTVDWSMSYSNTTRYDSPGVKTIELRVRDGAGRESVARLQVFVE